MNIVIQTLAWGVRNMTTCTIFTYKYAYTYKLYLYIYIHVYRNVLVMILNQHNQLCTKYAKKYTAKGDMFTVF